jgi:hypothetical protein
MSKPLFQRLGLLAATAITAVALVACGGDSSAPAAAKVVALSDLNLAINQTNKASAFALLTSSTSGFDYPSGVTLGGTAFPAPVNIKVGGTDADNMTFTITYGQGMGQGSATGTLAFGSCIFTIPSGVFAGTRTVPNCEADISLKGATFTPGTTRVSQFVWLLEATRSNATSVSLQVAANGVVTLILPSGTSITLGTVSVTAATGATGT